MSTHKIILFDGPTREWYRYCGSDFTQIRSVLRETYRVGWGVRGGIRIMLKLKKNGAFDLYGLHSWVDLACYTQYRDRNCSN
ncbi:hypothetical protein PNOK_0123200 [Pyrrhoderma noxium]|uniref:Uncharacterized protein n=1 Tax=Pyrrhoderma noxium TaxID=2282107 RepID=A0A286UX92_9AGAM|nr:hypothetical protein PNOK_0123200 [Pyrrhoderma noxium]